MNVNPLPGFIFIDCEANGLVEAMSFPIEVGVATCDGAVESHLVAQTLEWSALPWDMCAQDVHRISRSELRLGRDVRWIASWLNAACRNKAVCSDNPDAESFWLAQIFDAAQVTQEFEVGIDARHLIDGLSKGLSGMPSSYRRIGAEVKDAYPITHRAGEDASHWAVKFREVMASLYAGTP